LARCLLCKGAMDSLPPRREDLPPSRPTWPAGALEARPEESFGVCFVVGGAVEGGATESVDLAGGGVRLTTRVAGRVARTSPESTTLVTRAGEVVLRHLLPVGIDLAPLSGRSVNVRVDHTLADDTTVDARIWDDDGHLLLWARDGRLPDREAPMSGAFLAIHGVDRPSRLVLTAGSRRLAARAGDVRELELAGGAFGLSVLRVERRAASFLLVSR